MKPLLWCLVIALLMSHQDYWQWNDATLVFGFLPYALVYHVGVTLAAAAVWLLATTLCWPHHLEHVGPVSDPGRIEE